MSMEICVLSDVRLKSMSDWQQAINADAFPLRLSYSKALTQLDGFLPTFLLDKKTGFECHHTEARELIDTYPEVQFGRQWTYGLVFVWSGNFMEMRAAWMAAAAYARAAGGVVFDTETGEVLSPDRAVEIAKDIERRMSNPETIVRK